MGRKKKAEPRYLEHKQSGRGRACYYDAAGAYHDVLLPGLYKSKESLAAFGRLLVEQSVAPAGSAVPAADRPTLTTVEVLDLYFQHAERHYRRPDGSPTSKLTEVKLVIRAVRELYGDTPAAEFSPLKLKAVRQKWVVGGLSRNEANNRTAVAKRIFKWAVSEELVPGAVLVALQAVKGLEAGRTAARETDPVKPVADATVDATLPFLNRHVRGMVEFQRLTGCRPGEVCSLRLCDIDRSEAVWLFRPPHHKTAHRGKTRVIAIGPKAQAVLAPFLSPDADPNAYVFSPALAVAEVRAGRAAARKSPRYRSEVKRRKAAKVKTPRRRPADKYPTHAYSVAVDRACDQAFPLPADLAPKPGESKKAWAARLTPGERERARAWRKKHRWHPNQLRHTFATAVRKAHGLEAAQVLLGHSRADVTQVYAERNEQVAIELASKIG